MRTKLKNWLEVLVFNFLFLFVLLIIVESILESKQNDNDLQFVTSRFVKLREFALPGEEGEIIPPAEMENFAENLEIKAYKVAIDSLGFIKSGNAISDPQYKIVFLGGSTTECRFVDDTLRFPALVSKKFQQFGKSLNAYNSGYSGNNTLHSINTTINKVIHRQFNVAVLMHNINDLTWLSCNRYYHKEKHPNNGITYATLSNPEANKHDMSFFVRYNAFFRFKKSVQLLFPKIYENVYLAKYKLLKPVFNDIDMPHQPLWPLGEEQFQQFENNLKTFISICNANNIRPVLMTQFNRINVDEINKNPIHHRIINRLEKGSFTANNFCKTYERINNIIRLTARNENVILIDLDKEVPGDKQYLYDMIHLNNKGSRFVADIIYRELNSLLFSQN